MASALQTSPSLTWPQTAKTEHSTLLVAPPATHPPWPFQGAPPQPYWQAGVRRRLATTLHGLGRPCILWQRSLGSVWTTMWISRTSLASLNTFVVFLVALLC
ncbi:unnamed protein product [Symbiodinium pilosum]|uniref:Uncharacterized protein n=1 Tax=Symbiodinium pilosum TaxID=2952 RepID=A0A812XYU8_SYMPI|nr:unnamed protein product [Symbiodinium pilosum]